jgi:hypothetical protein
LTKEKREKEKKKKKKRKNQERGLGGVNQQGQNKRFSYVCIIDVVTSSPCLLINFTPEVACNKEEKEIFISVIFSTTPKILIPTKDATGEKY